MSVSGIFKVLIIAVACVLIGALILNVILPNAVASVVNAIEGTIYNATGMHLDFNGDGAQDKMTDDIANANGTIGDATTDQNSSAGVTGFENGN